MKQNLKKSKLLLALSLAGFLFGCQKEEFYEMETNSLKVNEYTFNEANRMPMFNKAYHKVIKGINAINSTSRSENLGFVIDSSTIKTVTVANATTYTMRIIRPTTTNSYFENLIINVTTQDSTKAFITKYTPTEATESVQLHDSESFQGTGEIKEIDFEDNTNNNNNRSTLTCIDIVVCDWGGTTHLAGVKCGTTRTIRACVESQGGAGGFVFGYGGNSSSTGTGGNTGSSGNGTYSSGIVTAPVPVTYTSINLTSTLSLNTTQQQWIDNPNQFRIKKQLQQFLFNANLFNNNSAQVFAKEAINALMNGGEVDFDNEIILDSSFENNQKVKCVFQKLLSSDLNTDTYFKNIIVNLFDSNDKANIKFSISSLPAGFDAVTLPKSPYIFPGNSMYDIILDSTFAANASNIEIALTLIHELIHAELIQRLLDLGIVTQVAYNNNYDAIFIFADGTQLSNSTPSILINYLIQQYLNFSAPSEWNHNLITAFNYVNTISENLQLAYPLLNDPNNDFLNNINNDPTNTNGNFTLEQALNYLSWRGLESTQLYQTNIQNIPSELNKKNYIDNSSRTKFTSNCN